MKRAQSFCLNLAIAACLSFTTALRADDNVATDSTQAILQQPTFREGLFWIGPTPPTETESAKLLAIIQGLDQPGWTTKVEAFLLANPNSPWAASLHYDYASFSHRTGRTSKALEHWQAAWELVKHDTSGAGRRLGGEILANWTEQLSSLGRRDQLKELIPAGDQWPFVNPQDREKFQSAKANYYLMGNQPGMSFRCGTLALKAVGQALQPTNQTLESLVDIPSPTNGFGIGALVGFAKEHGLDLIAARRVHSSDLIVPSVIHWRQNHYAAILDQQDGLYLVNDPTFGTPKWMSPDAINDEASGAFLIPATAQTTNWQALETTELASIRGKGLPNNLNDGKDKGCNQGFCPICNGMPVWWVSEPYINVWMADEPLSYLTSRGEEFSFRTSYKQRDTRPRYGPGVPNTGWNNSWVSFIELDSEVPCPSFNCSVPNYSQADATLYLPNGGAVYFPTGQRYDSETRLLLQLAEPQNPLLAGQHDGDGGLQVIHADGSRDVYGLVVPTFTPMGDYPVAYFERTRQIDAHGDTTSFSYYNPNQQFVLTNMVDYDGRTNYLGYTYNATIGINLLTSVTNAYGQTAHFKYDGNGNLTNITDAAGLSSSMTYDANGYPTKLITPYGTNQFALYVNPGLTTNGTGDGNMGILNSVDRAVLVTDPVGGQHLYLYRYDSSSFMPSNFPSSDVPTSTPLGTLDNGTGGTNALVAISYRNSFSWDAREYAALSTTNLTGLTTNDFLRGRMKHWLQDTNDLTLSSYLSVERDPSPDGTTEGLKTFYDYQGKTYPHRAGTNALPSVAAWRLPNGETHYEYVRYDYFGNITNRVKTYTAPNGTLATRTNQYIYANNTYTNVFHCQYWNEDYTSNFFLPCFTNTFTIPNLLTQVIEPNGSNSWTYGPFDVVAWTNFIRVDNMGDTNLLILYSRRVFPDNATNGVGEVTTRTFTGFNKLTSIQFPAGLTRTNLYDPNGFLAQTVDQQIHRTNSFGYNNGLISTYTNELGLTVNFSWDNLLRLTGINFPDTTTVSNVYTRLDLTGQKDRLGNWTLFAYDGLRHLTTVTNANQQVTSFGWCDCGSLTSITDALTNTTMLSYDFQSRLTNVLFPDASSHTYQYDLAGRKTSITDGAGRSASLIYNNQGLVTNVNDTYGTIARAVFDILDRPASYTDANNITATNTYDMLNRLVARSWTADGIGEGFVYATNGLVAYTNRDYQVTRYGRDTAGRLTAITNANVPAQVTQLFYDAANHLTNLTDGLNHTTAWNYNQFGWVTNKVDATNRQIFLYSYDADGRLTNRWMLASGNTGFSYDADGNLTNIVYSNSVTPSVHLAYDPVDRLTNMQDAIGTTRFGYTALGQLATETGPWANSTVSFLYNQSHRTNLSLSQPVGGSWNQGYAYDGAWRLTQVASPSGTFAYGYPSSASTLIQSLALPNAAGITYQYDALARLTNTALANYWGQVLDGYAYADDAWGLRTNITRNLGITTNQVIAGYDNIGQLISWSAKESSGALRFNEQLGYGYDAAGNLDARTNGELSQAFNVDTLNQLSTVTRSGTFTLTGATPAPATNVTVNGNAAQRYGDFTFARTNLTLVDGANTFTNVATNVYGVVATSILTANLPVTTTLLYDANGNLTNDGIRNLVYDAENQLTNVNVAGQWKTEYAYDGLRRKRITRDYTWQSGSWLKTNETRYLYDRLQVVQERDSNNVPLVTYTRGLDVSLTLQGAGGIGGLLARTDANGTAFYHSDGSGNITALLDGDQNVVARYEYDGFGRLIGKWGALADANAYRFSSKEYQRNSGLYSYGYRFYDPTLQRWLNRDPIGIRGGVNLYRLAYNNPVSYLDADGRFAPASSVGSLSLEGAATTAGEGGGLLLGNPAGVVAGIALLDAAAGYGLGDAIGDATGLQDRIANALNPDYDPSPLPLPQGWTGEDGQYQDEDGTTRNVDGTVAKDENGNDVNPQNGKPCPDGKPKLISNPKHHPNSKTPEPKNAKELYGKSVRDKNGSYYAKDDDGNIHRFSPSSNGETHWNGSTGSDRGLHPNQMPSRETLNQLK